MAPFSSVYQYNPPATGKPVICQFDKNIYFISSVTTVPYKNHKNCEWFQWTLRPVVQYCAVKDKGNSSIATFLPNYAAQE